MRRIFVILGVLALLASRFILPESIYAQNRYTSGETVIVENDEVIKGNFFAAGEKIQIEGVIQGDAYLAGGNIIVNGTIEGDLLVAGGNVIVNGIVNQDVRLAAGEVSIMGEVFGSVTALSGNVNFTESAFVGGGLVLAAGDANIAGTIERDIEAAVGNLNISESAIIGGNINYTSEDDAHVAKLASISGTIAKRAIPQWDMPSKAGITEFGNAVGFASKLVSIVTSVILGLIMLKLFPRHLQNVSAVIEKQFGRSFLIGLGAIIVVPIALIILLVSVVGIPFVFIVGALFFVYLYIVRIAVMNTMGKKLIELVNKKAKIGPIGVFLIGLTSYYLISLIPIFGGLIIFVLTLAALGGGLINDKETYLQARKKEII